MNLPPLITSAALRSMARPDETHAMRVIVRSVQNSRPYRLRGKRYHYLAERDPGSNVHCLDIPASVWMNGFPQGTYRDNPSLAHDLQGNRAAVGMSPLLFGIVPWVHGDTPLVAPTSTAPAQDLNLLEAFDAFDALLADMDAPEIITSAFALLRSNTEPGQIAEAIGQVRAKLWEEIERKSAESLPAPPADPAPPAPAAEEPKPPLSNAQRQRLHRERKKAEKQAAKVAAGELNPA